MKLLKKIVLVVVLISGLFLAGCANHDTAHYDLESHLGAIQNRYSGKDGIKHIKFNSKKNHLIIYMTDQNHKKSHQYKDAAAPITKQSEHAIKVSHKISKQYHDHKLTTYFK